MNKKKLGTGLIALALVGVVGIGGSLAWFTDNESASNTFTTGNINIKLTEEVNDGSGTQDGTGYKYVNVMPGDTLDKKVKVELDGTSQAAWVRLVVTLTSDNTEIFTALEDGDPDNDIQLMNGETAIDVDWTVNEEKTEAVAIYDQGVHLDSASDSWVPFTDVYVPETWGNDFKDTSFSIDVKAEAIQYEHNENGFTGIASEDIESFE